MKMGQSVPKRRRIKFRRRGLTQKKDYNAIILLIRLPIFTSLGMGLESVYLYFMP